MKNFLTKLKIILHNKINVMEKERKIANENKFFQFIKTVKEYSTVITLTLSAFTLIAVIVGYYISLNATLQAVKAAEASNEKLDAVQHPTFVTKDELKNDLTVMQSGINTINDNVKSLQGYFHLVPKDFPEK